MLLAVILWAELLRGDKRLALLAISRSEHLCMDLLQLLYSFIQQSAVLGYRVTMTTLSSGNINS